MKSNAKSVKINIRLPALYMTPKMARIKIIDRRKIQGYHVQERLLGVALGLGLRIGLDGRPKAKRETQTEKEEKEKDEAIPTCPKN